jgi:hypothetical protein
MRKGERVRFCIWGHRRTKANTIVLSRIRNGRSETATACRICHRHCQRETYERHGRAYSQAWRARRRQDPVRWAEYQAQRRQQRPASQVPRASAHGYGSRPRLLTPVQRRQIQQAHARGRTYKDLALRYQVSYSTVVRCCRPPSSQERKRDRQRARAYYHRNREHVRRWQQQWKQNHPEVMWLSRNFNTLRKDPTWPKAALALRKLRLYLRTLGVSESPAPGSTPATTSPTV